MSTSLCKSCNISGESQFKICLKSLQEASKILLFVVETRDSRATLLIAVERCKQRPCARVCYNPKWTSAQHNTLWVQMSTNELSWGKSITVQSASAVDDSSWESASDMYEIQFLKIVIWCSFLFCQSGSSTSSKLKLESKLRKQTNFGDIFKSQPFFQNWYIKQTKKYLHLKLFCNDFT